MKKIDFEEGADLTSCETVIMKAIWDEGGNIPTMQLREHLKEHFGKDYSRTTLATFLVKMSDKGFVKNYRVGKSAYVQALKSEEVYKQELLEDTKKFWFDGKASELVCTLFRQKHITKEEMEEIRRTLDGLDN